MNQQPLVNPALLGSREDYEIMAPVGSWESLAAALQAGADSVYFGIEKLNMRSHSSSILRTTICVRLWHVATKRALKRI